MNIAKWKNQAERLDSVLLHLYDILKNANISW